MEAQFVGSMTIQGSSFHPGFVDCMTHFIDRCIFTYKFLLYRLC